MRACVRASVRAWKDHEKNASYVLTTKVNSRRLSASALQLQCQLPIEKAHINVTRENVWRYHVGLWWRHALCTHVLIYCVPRWHKCKYLVTLFFWLCFKAEGAIDTGGPTREMLHFFMAQCVSGRYMRFMEGPWGKRQLCVDNEGKFWAVECFSFTAATSTTHWEGPHQRY